MIKANPKGLRSRRIRKKLHTDEFQELGFAIEMTLGDHLDSMQGEAFIDRFLADLIEPNGMAYGGWTDGYVVSSGQGSLGEQHRTLISEWLSATHEVDKYIVHALTDCWYPHLHRDNDGIGCEPCRGRP